MQYIHRFTRSFIMLSLLAFVLVIGFSGLALADEKAAETKAEGEMKADGDAKAQGEMKADGDAKAEGEMKADGDAKAEGEKKADEAK